VLQQALTCTGVQHFLGNRRLLTSQSGNQAP